MKLQKQKENLSIVFFYFLFFIFNYRKLFSGTKQDGVRVISNRRWRKSLGRCSEKDATSRCAIARQRAPRLLNSHRIPVPYQVPKVDPLDLDSIPVRASTVSTISDLSLIPVAMLIHPKHNKFNQIRNGNGNWVGVGVVGYSRELNTPKERHRFSLAFASASRTHFELQSSNEEGLKFTNGIRNFKNFCSFVPTNSIPKIAFYSVWND